MIERNDRSSLREAAAEADIPLEITEVDQDRIGAIRRLNVAVFDDSHIINTFEQEDLLMLLARTDGSGVGFKIGYQLDETTYYSAKGGVHPAYRRNGIARALLYAMLGIVEGWGYRRFVYDTFPNKHPGMTVLGLNEGFRVVRAGYSTEYEDYRLRLEWSFDEA